ncbi:TlyA family RNA methyltransferase [Patescibacteria group bacterium]|nr:TlyA family RNA methyltransferase [Patescibacteria group bacterium]
MSKIRADWLVSQNPKIRSRKMAADLIKSGKVKIGDKVVSKPSSSVAVGARVEIVALPKYVGRGGLKLEHALTEFAVDVADKIVLDVGSSVGGFTDCVLRHGAKKVYAVDVGTNQLSSKLRKHPKVVLYEQTDIRRLGVLPELIDAAVVDVSFISLTEVLPSIYKLLKPRGQIVALIKPQFEVESHKLNKRGVVKDEGSVMAVVSKIKSWAEGSGFLVKGVCKSPIKGAEGNVEFFIHLVIRK